MKLSLKVSLTLRRKKSCWPEKKGSCFWQNFYLAPFFWLQACSHHKSDSPRVRRQIWSGRWKRTRKRRSPGETQYWHISHHTSKTTGKLLMCCSALQAILAALFSSFWHGFTVTLCPWFLIRRAIWYVLNCQIYEYYVIFIYFQADVSALCWLSQFCRNRLREYSKIRQFDTYQLAFLMKKQGH